MELHVPGFITKFSDVVIFVEYVPYAKVTVMLISLLLYIGLEDTIINCVI